METPLEWSDQLPTVPGQYVMYVKSKKFATIALVYESSDFETKRLAVNVPADPGAALLSMLEGYYLWLGPLPEVPGSAA